MDFLQRIDAKILSFFTKISHKFQIMTGRTNFFLSNIFLTLFALNVTENIINYWFNILTRKTNIVSLLFSLFFVVLISRDKINLKKADDTLFDSDGLSAKPRFSLSSNHIVRLIMLAFACLSIISIYLIVIGVPPAKISRVFEIFHEMFPMILVCYYYFIEVTPLPPGKSKIKEWLESFGKVLKPIPVRSRD